MTDGFCASRCRAAFGPVLVTLGGVFLLWSLCIPPAWGQLFLEAPEYSTGQNPRSVAVGDFNGDGKNDLAIANLGDRTISIRLGNGDGTFQTSVNYRTGSGPGYGGRSLVVGEFNGDGKADLAVANSSDNTVSVLLGNGDGTFQARLDYAVGSFPEQLAVGDLNGDGKADLAVADAGARAVSVLLGNGDGTFQANVEYPTGLTTRGMAVGDFNGDGKPDLATTISGGLCQGWVAIFLGKGDGTFLQHVDSPSVGCNYQVAVGDFNEDGKEDLVVVDNWVSILLGNGDGTFQPAVRYRAGGNNTSIALFDFDGDGRLDLALTDFIANAVSVLLGNGDGTFQARLGYGTGQEPLSLAVGDFDGDGVVDLVTANSGSSTASVLLGNGDGTFVARRDYPAESNPGAAAAGDINNDGYPDLVVGNRGPLPSSVSVFLGRGDGVFPAHVVSPDADDPISLALADFNKDQKMDVVTVGRSNTLSVLLGNGDGTFQAHLDTIIDGPRSVAVGDFNRDGKLDIVVALFSGSGLGAGVLLGNGDGTFQPEVDYATGGAATYVAVADFNHDGNLDLAMTIYPLIDETAIVSVLLGNGDGTFQLHTDYAIAAPPFPQGPFAVAVGDLNGDGNQDMVVAGACGCISVLLGNGDGTFRAHQDYAAPSFTDLVALGDFNGDGKLDVAVTGVGVFLGNGDGTLQTREDYATGSGGGNVVVWDLNGDRKPDLALSNGSGADSVSVLLNNVRSPFFTLSVATSGSGSGTVTITPGGAKCTGSCSRNFASGTALTLSATAAFGSSFSGWSGAGCSGTGTCNLTITSDQTVTATFDLAPDFAVAVSALSPGSVNPGQSATSTIDVTAAGGFNSSVALTCAVSPTPQLAPQCSISPSSVNPGTPATLSVTTTGPQAGLASPWGRAELFYALWLPVCGLTLMGMVFTAQRKKTRLLGMLCCVPLFAALLLLPACGGSSGGSHGSSGTPPGTYTISVTGTSGTTHSTTVTLKVQ